MAHQNGDVETKHQLDYILEQFHKDKMTSSSRLSLESSDDASTSTISDGEDDDPTLVNTENYREFWNR